VELETIASMAEAETTSLTVALAAITSEADAETM
jgi:hypothetical protein